MKLMIWEALWQVYEWGAMEPGAQHDRFSGLGAGPHASDDLREGKLLHEYPTEKVKAF